MSLTLGQAQALRQMAGVLYSFLPGSGHSSWKGHVSFPSVAGELGIASFWPGGSKQPAIAALLERTLNHRPDLFEKLVLSIIRNGLTYRERQGHPIQAGEIETLVGLLLQAGFRFSELSSPDFLRSLGSDSVQRAGEMGHAITRIEEASAVARARTSQLQDLQAVFLNIAGMEDRQAAGREFEAFLSALFQLFSLAPRSSFRVIGEQIDGSFLLDNNVYLVEAKWLKGGVSEADLLIFRGKITGKSALTRGVFISLHGATEGALDAITRGKQPIFPLIDGADLFRVLQDAIDLPTLLRRKLRRLAEEGRVFVPAKDLM